MPLSCFTQSGFIPLFTLWPIEKVSHLSYRYPVDFNRIFIALSFFSNLPICGPQFRVARVRIENCKVIKPQEILGALNPFEQKNAPKEIFYCGDLSLLQSGGRVSVVGSRKASPAGLRRAQFISKWLVNADITVVSGLAEGIDAVAHQTAIAEGGRTVAVLGTSLDNPYPKSNEALFKEIATDHLVVSQFPFKSQFQTKNFPIRNRTMALVSHATIIIEAGEKSGTLHQGWEALRLGRLLYLLENVVKNEQLTWPKEMIKYGAQVLTKENLDDVIQEIPRLSALDQSEFLF